MGRVITTKFKKEDGSKFSDKEIEIVINVANKYNSGKLSDVWSCESFYPRPLNFMVDWNGKKGMETKMILRQQLNNGNGYDWEAYIDTKIEQLMKGKPITIGEKSPQPFVYSTFKKEFTRVEAVKFLAKEGWITYDKIDNEFFSFTKVQGNEFNAMLVFLACKELSMLIPKMEIEMEDEGEFLLCPIKISCGRAIPLLSHLVEQMEHMALKMLFSKGFKGNILNKLDCKEKDFEHEFRMDVKLNNSYGDMTAYINKIVNKIKLVETRLLPLVKDDKYGGKNEMYFQSLENRPKEKGWFDVELFTRITQVKVDDFVTYEMSPATIMDGFSGNYYGLSKEDSESESYKRIAQMQELFGKLGIDGTKLEILGEKK